MKRGATLFLRAVLALADIGALALLLREPKIEGRNAHATLFAIYFNDPFLAYGVFMGVIITFAAIVVATTMAVLERALQLDGMRLLS